MTQVAIADLIAGVRAGSLASFPTDTVPALAVLPERADLIFAAKGRSREKPLILMGASPEALWPYVKGSAEEKKIWQKIAAKYWPGALTLVLPASDRVPLAMNQADPTTIGVRVPDCAIAQKILAQTGPLATTSANRSGEAALQTMAEIETQFPDVLTLDIAELESVKRVIGLPSTVVKWTGSGWEILRQGGIVLTSDGGL
ncbi:L-threonylcarbamoyladenylate synthase [Microcoleus sp. FACHB-831]|uniref:L-threonylcarbamoyladenylate synthase n=1 Tax=Microcoleus sp. FACHB-831 TaxID=2692827 RepID=UPI0016876022|nr:L-threonylcarbamoyladenylate synthase [Microcoleus sp. FACHB-831]MBD1921826.1 L-threonylcarbamoyladenylate synthase [Microcoleus sp. FACHB-831]